MKCSSTDQRNQSGPFRCTGCGKHTAPHSSVTIADADDIPAGVAYACAECATRAGASLKFRKQFEIAASAGASLPDLERIFAAIGVWDVPTTPLECDEAIGLPPGSTEAALSGW